MINQKIIVAIDTCNLAKANFILDQLDPNLCKIKIGSVVFNALGKSFLKEVSNRGFKIFLDLKFHDIPNTVYETVLSFKDVPIEMLTAHLSGGEEMLSRAMHAAKSINSKVIGVSMLTSLKDRDSITLFDAKLNELIVNLFLLAKKINLDGVVCSPHELGQANEILESNTIKITPGIRDIKTEDDQARTSSALEAIQSGATFLVIGRPITQAENISAALNNFCNSINE